MVTRKTLANGEPGLTVPVEHLVRHVLSNLVSAIAKQDDSPASAETHLMSAISELAKATQWRPYDIELAAIIDDAISHMELHGK